MQTRDGLLKLTSVTSVLTSTPGVLLSTSKMLNVFFLYRKDHNNNYRIKIFNPNDKKTNEDYAIEPEEYELH
jgi:hypothetical protein